MKKLLLALFFCGLLLNSCSNDDDGVSHASDGKNTKKELLKGISVVSLSDFDNTIKSGTRSLLEESKVLRFEDQKTFDDCVELVRDMSVNEQQSFFEEIQFQPAMLALALADDELDKIFDIEDDTQFLNEYNKYQNKHGEQFVYNTEDTYDLSPYLKFNDDELRFVGNENGMVVIGDRLVKPESKIPAYHKFIEEDKFIPVADDLFLLRNDFDPYPSYPPPNYDKVPAPTPKGPQEYVPNFMGYKGVTMMIKQGKYQSTMSLGRLPDGESGKLVVRYASQKKKKFWKRRHETTYEGKVQIDSNGTINFPCGLKRKEVFIISNVYRPSGRFTARMFDFSSGCCNNQKGEIKVTAN